MANHHLMLVVPLIFCTTISLLCFLDETYLQDLHAESLDHQWSSMPDLLIAGVPVRGLSHGRCDAARRR